MDDPARVHVYHSESSQRWHNMPSVVQPCAYYSATGTMAHNAGKQLPDYFLPLVGPSDNQRMGDRSSFHTPGKSMMCEKIL
ncbi:unnamed protein product [Lota lota]